MDQTPRVAIVHEWFTSMRGGEKCVEALCEVFPQATLFVLLHTRGSVSDALERMPVRTSFVQQLPFAAQHYRHYLPLFPAAVRQFDLGDADVVISSHHCVAKGVRAPAHALHICYCHTPMRYLWDLYDDYFGKGRAGTLTRIGMTVIKPALRWWDVRTAKNPHFYIANSRNIQEKIQRLYHRRSEVIYPPVDTAAFTVSRGDNGYYLIVSALVPYKRIDLAIQVFNTTGERLVIVGEGPDAGRLRTMAGASIEFVGWQSAERLREFYAGCKAVLFPGEEDFGIVPLEAMASGKPVIAYARGGALETVRFSPELQTGILFEKQDVQSLLEALGRFREAEFDPHSLRRFAETFDREVYKAGMRRYVLKRWAEFRGGSRQPHA